MPKSSSPANVLTRKVGPAPVWAWAVMALVLVFLWQHYHTGAAQAAPSPSGDVPPQSSGQPQGDAGAGNAASNLPADMLNALTSGAFGNYSYIYSPTDSHDITSSVDYGTGNWSPTSPGTGPPGPQGPPGPAGSPYVPPSYTPPPVAPGGYLNPPGGFGGVLNPGYTTPTPPGGWYSPGAQGPIYQPRQPVLN